ncbi:helicase SRCAP-like, partial [Pezoporus wallicus]|uniref:helicase SRCAP-like n=1 Tax=Pezoporus wallicus TaxID=35540 RepID=UPI00254DBF48
GADAGYGDALQHRETLHRLLRPWGTHFPDRRLVQYDCGKLQTLDVLLRRLKAGAHRVLIFTQMTRMLDVLERFLTYHGHIYLRLDGSTRVEQRQALMERFNADRRIFCFILSTRSGGVGVNLAGADTVVFYDSDWNPTMDAQAQDRCHRIGQTRDVHIYRLISERTVEENILKKANQKRMLGDMAIEGGNFTTAYFKQQTIRELFDMAPEEPGRDKERDGDGGPEEDEDPAATRRTHILEQALCGAEDPEDIRAASQARAERVAAMAEFSESLSPEEELSKAEQEIAALVGQLTPIERYAMNFLEASLEDVSREELKQAEEQVEAARKDIDQAKGVGGRFRLPPQEEEEEEEEKAGPKAEVGGASSGGVADDGGGRRYRMLLPLPPPPSPPPPPVTSPPRPAPRRRRSADVEIRQSRGPGPAAKVLRQLPGRLVTVLEAPPLPPLSRHHPPPSSSSPRRRRRRPAPSLDPSPPPHPPKRRRGRPPKRRGVASRRRRHPGPAHPDPHPPKRRRRRGRPSRSTSAPVTSGPSPSPFPPKRRRGRPPKRSPPSPSPSPPLPPSPSPTAAPPPPRSTRRHPSAPLLAPLEREPGRRHRKRGEGQRKEGEGGNGSSAPPPPAPQPLPPPKRRRAEPPRRTQPPRRCAEGGGAGGRGRKAKT